MKNLKRKKVISRTLYCVAPIAIVSALLVSACATAPSSSLEQTNGKITLANSSIGEHYDAVINRAVESYEVDPQCETRKISLVRQRKAFIYDICGFNPEGQSFANAPMAEVVYQFIERKLVRIDVIARGNEQLLERVTSDVQSVFSDTEADTVADKQNSFEWITSTHIAGVRAGGGANAGNIHVRLLDKTLMNDAPWLTQE